MQNHCSLNMVTIMIIISPGQLTNWTFSTSASPSLRPSWGNFVFTRFTNLIFSRCTESPLALFKKKTCSSWLSLAAKAAFRRSTWEEKQCLCFWQAGSVIAMVLMKISILDMSIMLMLAPPSQAQSPPPPSQSARSQGTPSDGRTCLWVGWVWCKIK